MFDHGVDPIAQIIGILHVLEAALHAEAETAGIGLIGDIANGTAHIALAVERALGSFQDLDAFHVK